jgi:hypothetical protein
MQGGDGGSQAPITAMVRFRFFQCEPSPPLFAYYSDPPVFRNEACQSDSNYGNRSRYGPSESARNNTSWRMRFLAIRRR